MSAGRRSEEPGDAQDAHDAHSHSDGCPCGKHAPTVVDQTVAELDFDRGLWAPARSGNANRVVELLDRGLPHSLADRAGYTPLHYAARNGHKRVCELLLGARAVVDPVTTAGKATPLHRAAFCGHDTIVKLLLRRKANPAAVDLDGQTPLHKAAASGSIATVSTLVETVTGKAAASVVDNRGRRPADCVPTGSQADLLRLLSCENP